MLTEVLPEALPDAQAVKGFFDSLTWQKVIPPLVLLLVGLVAVRLLLRLFDRALERSRLERAAYAMLRSVMKVLLYFILLLLVAAQLGVDVLILHQSVLPHHGDSADHTVLDGIPVIHHDLTSPLDTIIADLIVGHVH